MSDSVRPQRRQPTRLLRPWDSPGKNTGVGCHFLLQWVKVKSLSRVQLLATPWTVAYEAPPSMGFPRQEYWSGLPLPSLNLILLGLKNYSFLSTLHFKNWFGNPPSHPEIMSKCKNVHACMLSHSVTYNSL